MDREQIKDVAFEQAEDLYNKQIQAVPRPEKEIGIDLSDSVLLNIINSQDQGISSQFDVAALQNFTNISRNRNQFYDTLDYMAQDSIISAILETYTEDATESNDTGDIVWVESADANAVKFIKYLLDALCINKNIYDWTHSLCKYGDLYVRLYRESEYDAFLFDNKKQDIKTEVSIDNNGQVTTTQKEKKSLNEDVNIRAYKDNDHYVHYAEKVDNPAQMFELTKFGKTAAYIKTDVQANTDQADDVSTMSTFLNRYRFNKNDVDLYQPTEFVHASLQDNTTRTSEEVQLFITNDDKSETNMTYKVKRGQSLLQGSYKVWRQLQLLETSVLLNRLTQSSIIRTIGVEVGDMPKEQVGPHLAGIKQMIEQKSAFDVGSSMNEYSNPGPIINNIYVPTREGKGAITASQIGGDVDVKSLADLGYYQDKLFGSARVPKQYFGVTDDNAGFSGGQSLSIISSRYAKMIKRIQSTMCQMITDMINLILLDTQNEQYINNFVIKMLPPTTQEEIDRRDNVSSKIGLVRDIMDTLADIENPITKLTILKTLLSNTITDSDVIQLIEEEIEAMQAQIDSQNAGESPENLSDSEIDDMFGAEEPFDFKGGSSGSTSSDSVNLFSTEEPTDFETDMESEEPIESDTLPSPADLNIGDVSDSTNPELV